MRTHTDNARGLHVAIIMDGNGRWAEARGWPREAGHRAGADAVRRTVESGPETGRAHPDALRLLVGQLEAPGARGVGADAPVPHLPGARNRPLRGKRRPAERDRPARPAAGAAGADDRTGRSARPPAARTCTCGWPSTTPRATRSCAPPGACAAGAAATREEFARLLNEAGPAPDVDLLIRTGGEQRLSDFLLWECAYAELHFTPAHVARLRGRGSGSRAGRLSPPPAPVRGRAGHQGWLSAW